MRYHNHIPASKQYSGTPQNQPMRADQVRNSAAGFVWQVDRWTRARRFLILGAETGTYYIGERALTVENATALIECLQEDGLRLIRLIQEVSEGGLAPKNDPVLFALALACAPQFADEATRSAALAALPALCRTGTHLFTFAEFVQAFRGWGRQLRKGIADWYTGQRADKLALQLIKYRQRNGWAHRDLLRLAHPKTEDAALNALLGWAAREELQPELPPLIEAFIALQSETDRDAVIRAITEQRFPREALPTEWLNDVEIWRALLTEMPLTALIRNLGKLTQVGLLVPGDSAEQHITARLADVDALHRARIHPIALLAALKTYAQGHGERGKLAWKPNVRVIDSLNEAFYSTFQNVERAGKRFVIGLDVSGSMAGTRVNGVPGLEARTTAGAMALLLANTETVVAQVAFDTAAYPLTISPHQRLDDVINLLARTGGGGTDCAVPIRYAVDQRLMADVIVILTDSESWAGGMHPFEAFQLYREKVNPAAKLVTVAMCANQFTLNAPDDPAVLDVVGFDAAAPAIISAFAAEAL